MTRNPEKTAAVLGLPLYRMGMRDALRECDERTTAMAGGYACFVNVHSITEATRNAATRGALLDATFAFPDGVPLVWASRLGPVDIRERVCGPDFMSALLRAHPKERFGFIGGTPEQVTLIATKYGIESIAYSPPFRSFSVANAREDWERFLAVVRSSGGKIPRFVWVGLGAPKQELWMRAISPSATETFFFGVGAAVDFLAGSKRRAPKWMQRLGLEWFFRILQEPGRLWRRYLVTNTRFLIAVTFDFFRRGKSRLE